MTMSAPQAATATALSHLPYVDAIRAAIRPVIADNSPLYNPIVHVLSARMACSVERGLKPTYAQEDALNVERSLMLDPMGTIGRYFRTVLLGAEINGNVVTFTPQKDCIPMRLIVPSVDAAKTFTDMQAGLEQYFASNDAVTGSMFGIGQQATYIRPIYTRVGQNITITANSAPTDRGYAMVCADMSSAGRLAGVGQLRPIGFAGSVLASGGLVVRVRPQKCFRVRKLSIKGTLTTVTVEDFKVGVDPQFLSADKVTAELFDATAPWTVWLDADMAQIGQDIQITFASSSGDIPIAGVIEGDVCDC